MSLKTGNRTKKRSKADHALKRLRLILTTFLLCLTPLLYGLISKLYSQLDAQVYFSARSQAEELLERVSQQALEKLASEEARSFAQYSFYNVEDNALLDSQGVKLSPLAKLPPDSTIAGLVGFFQIDPDGSFHTPSLPQLNSQDSSLDPSNLSQPELDKRQALQQQLQKLLNTGSDTFSNESRVAGLKQHTHTESTTTALNEKESNASESKDLRTKKNRVSKKKLEQLNIDSKRWPEPLLLEKEQSGKLDRYTRSLTKTAQQKPRKENVQLPSQIAASQQYQSPILAESLNTLTDKPTLETDTISTPASTIYVPVFSFESEIDPLQMISLGRSHFAFIRRVWRDNGRYTQGFVVQNDAFIQAIISTIFHSSRIGSMATLRIAYEGEVITTLQPRRDRLYYDSNPAQHKDNPETLLYRSLLSPPLQNLELLFTLNNLPTNRGIWLIHALVAALTLVLLIGLFSLYRLGTAQIRLTHQQSNFVAAVSHELKTPLTSIRMYSEMLRSDWITDEDKKKSYYDYIFFESERLSRLIANVLQLAKLEHHQGALVLEPRTPDELLRLVETKVNQQINSAGFKLNRVKPVQSSQAITVLVNEDAFCQIYINLVDNALKFSANTDNKILDIGIKAVNAKSRTITFYIRDYGPGIDKKQQKKIFALFYRAGDELTRAKPGTGIGLALVSQLAERMHGRVVYIDRNPGAEFQLVFKAVKAH